MTDSLAAEPPAPVSAAVSPNTVSPNTVSPTAAPSAPLPGELQRRASDPTTSVWVGASAGTGKTKVLTDRFLRILLTGVPAHKILGLTFTKAAAAEMAHRIFDTLSKWATVSDENLTHRLTDLCGEPPTPDLMERARRLFAEVVDCPGGMKIQTIHAFCQVLLRRFPIEASLPPQFEVLDDQTAQELLDAAKLAALREARRNPDSALGRALARIIRDVSQEEFDSLLQTLAAGRGQIRAVFDRFGGLDGAVRAVYEHLEVPDGTDDTTVLLDICRQGAFDEPGLLRACEALAGGTSSDQERGRAIRTWLLEADRAVGMREWAALFLTDKGTARARLITQGACKGHPAAKECLDKEAQRLAEAMDKVKAAGVAGSTAALLRIADAILDTYENEGPKRKP